MKKESGFTLLELFITLAVVLILGAAAVPAYLNYTKRTYFNETIIPAAKPYKKAITDCYHHSKNLKDCANKKHIPADIKVPKEGIASITLHDGSIVIVPAEKDGVKSSDTLVLTPKEVKGEVEWDMSGGAVQNKYVN